MCSSRKINEAHYRRMEIGFVTRSSLSRFDLSHIGDTVAFRCMRFEFALIEAEMNSSLAFCAVANSMGLLDFMKFAPGHLALEGETAINDFLNICHKG